MRSLFPVLLIVSINAFGQFDVNTYLSNSSSEIEMQSIKEQWRYLSETDFRSPFFRELEFRVRARDFDTGPDDYRFRLSPLNPYERRANKQYSTVIGVQMESQKVVEFSSVLEKRYLIIIRHIYLKKATDLEKSASDYYHHLLETKSKFKGSAKDLIELDRRLLSIALHQDDLQAEIDKAEYLIRLGYQFEGDISWGNYPLVTVETIQAQLMQFNDFNPETNIYVKNEQNKIRVGEKNLEVNRQEAFSNIGYVQAEYRPYRGESFSETAGVQIGFQLPVVNPDRPDQERRKLRLIKDKKDVSEVKREVELNIYNYKNSLTKTIQKYERVSKKLTSLQEFAISTTFSNVESLLELREYKDELQEMQLDMYIQIFSAYIHWLHYYGKLVEVPYRNYLTDNVDIFEMEEL